MSMFSQAFDLALHQLGLSRREYSRASGIPEAQVSKYARGLISAGTSSLETIAKSLPEEQRAMVVSAWLRDHTPECAHGIVKVETSRNVFQEEAPRLVMSPELESAIRHISNMAVKHSEIGELVIRLSEALKSRR